MELEQGEFVFRIGDTSNALYLLLTGKVEVCLPSLEKEACDTLEQFTPGDVFGDIALFAGIPRKTDAVALEPTSILVLTKEGFESTARRRPVISARIFTNLTTDISRRMIKMISKQQVARKQQAAKEVEETDRD